MRVFHYKYKEIICLGGITNSMSLEVWLKEGQDKTDFKNF